MLPEVPQPSSGFSQSAEQIPGLLCLSPNRSWETASHKRSPGPSKTGFALNKGLTMQSTGLCVVPRPPRQPATIRPGSGGLVVAALSSGCSAAGPVSQACRGGGCWAYSLGNMQNALITACRGPDGGCAHGTGGDYGGTCLS